MTADARIQALESALAAMREERDQARQLVNDHESGVANLNRVVAHLTEEREGLKATIGTVQDALAAAQDFVQFVADAEPGDKPTLHGGYIRNARVVAEKVDAALALTSTEGPQQP
jgi:hypothetical protein